MKGEFILSGDIEQRGGELFQAYVYQGKGWCDGIMGYLHYTPRTRKKILHPEYHRAFWEAQISIANRGLTKISRRTDDKIETLDLLFRKSFELGLVKKEEN